jgi:hypothetical protein
MKLTVVVMLVWVAISSVLAGCSLDNLSKSAPKSTATNQVLMMDGKSSVDQDGKDVKNIINDNNAGANDDLQSLKSQLQQQQQRLDAINEQQQVLQEQLKRQYINLQVIPTVNANAGRTKQGTASTAYIAFLAEESQFIEIESLASKELSIIPNRESSLQLSVPRDARFIAIKVGLRYTKKRSQLLIPLDSIDFDQPLVINVGACDISIKQGIDAELVPTFTTKLKYYQQPLVSCS